MKAVLAVLALAVVASAALRESEYQAQFVKFTQEYNKNYDIATFFTKYNTFKFWVDFVARHNAGNHTWEAGINQFSDMTPEEFETFVNGCLVGAENQKSVQVDMVSAPDQIDWRTKGAVVTRVKNQGSCGSCWAFSSTGSLEGAWQIKNGELIDMSEQQLVDCSGPFGNQGCNGGLMTNSFKYLAAQKPNGITDQTSYPYTGRQASCKKQGSTVATVDSHVALKANENDLGDALKLGPVSLALAAAGTFQSYKSGILESGCGTQLNHGVLLVGYTPDDKNGYWIVKNSWGQSWGNQGYIWIRAFKNVCAVGNQLNAYPIAGKKGL
jgi:cathepsin L